MKKVLIIGGNCQSLIRFRGELLKRFKENKLEVYACAGTYNEPDLNWFKELDIKFISLPFKRTTINPFNDCLFFLRLILTIKKINPDIVLAYTVKPVVYGMLASRICNVKKCHALITGLGYAFMPIKSFKHKIIYVLVKFLYKISLKKIKSVIFQNHDDLNLFINQKIISKSARYVKVNGSGVDLNYFKFKKPPSIKFGINFLLIARLLKDKGIYEYIEAAKIVRENFSKSKISFSLLGPIDTNPEAISLEDFNKFNKNKIIEYLGEVKDVRPYIEKCSVYVLPSYREGMPRSVLEAMSIGRAIITTNVPGCKETVIDGKNGYLIKKNSSKELASAMIKFIEDNRLINEMGLYSRELANERFDVHKVNSIMLEEMDISS